MYTEFSKRILLLASLLASSPLAIADSQYLSAGVGSADFGSPWGNSTSFEITAGADLGKNLSIEASYSEYGSVDWFTEEIPSSKIIDLSLAYPNDLNWESEIINQTTEINGNSISISFVQFFPLNELYSLYGKVGANFWTVDTKVIYAERQNQFNTIRLTREDDGLDPLFAVGAKFKFSDTLGASLEYQRASLEDNLDIDNLIFKLNYTLPH